MKQIWFDLFFIITIFILCAFLVFAGLSFIYEENNQTQDEIVQISNVKLLDRHITNDNKYEILYSITYTNGLSLQVWKQVDYNDYITLWEENRYDESAFIN